MIRVRKRSDSVIPEILSNQGQAAILILKERYNSGERDFKSSDFDSKIYGHTNVKEMLIKLQDNKCCFCESKIGHISYGDVEHFRPKAGWVQGNENLNKPGYYWLAYEWSNLLLSCEICNQRYKKNYFPLVEGSLRALSHNDEVNEENHIFLNPNTEDVEEFITFKEEIPVSVSENIRGKETISKLGLDRKLLNEERRKKLNLIRDIYDLAKGYPETSPELKNRAKQIVEKYKDESIEDGTEYASMLRSFFRDNPITF
jgi:uncharacterized protein (TIGR02646 family)